MEAALIGPQGRITLGSAPLRLGRAQDNNVPVSDPQASSHHAEITPGPNGTNYVLTDLGSTNGTFVNEQRIPPHTPQPLRSGDVIRLGNTSFSFEVAGSVEATVRASSSSPGLDATVIGPLSSSASSSPSQPQATPQPSYNSGTPSSPNLPPSFPSQTTGNIQPQPGYPQQPPQYGQGYPQQSGFAQQAPFAQPGYPQQPPQIPNYSQLPGIPGTSPFQESPRKSKTGLWIGLVLVAVLVIGGIAGGVWYVNYLNRSTPQKTLDAVCTAIKNGDAQAFYDQLSQTAKAKTKVSDIQQAFALITQFAGGVKSCTYTNVQENGSKATADITMEYNKPPPGTSTEPSKVNLVKENDTWKVDEDMATPNTDSPTI